MEKFSILELELEEVEFALLNVGIAEAKETIEAQFENERCLDVITKKMIADKTMEYDKEDLEQMALCYEFDKNGNII